MEKQKSPSIKEQLIDKTNSVEYAGGRVEYVLFGEQSDEHNPIAVVPGYTEGLVALHNFGRDLAKDGSRQVLITEQPEVDHKAKLDIVDHQAEAWLSTIEANDWQNRPVDVVAHSFGAIVFERAATLAYLRGWSCFDSKNGSKSVFIAPAGTNPEESLTKMTPRYLRLMKSIVAGKEKQDSRLAENGKEILDQGVKSTLRQPRKYALEIAPILSDRIRYSRLGKVGVKPFIIGFNDDHLFNHDTIGSTVLDNLEHTAGYSMVADQQATHNHMLYNGLTSEALLQIIDGKVAGVRANH